MVDIGKARSYGDFAFDGDAPVLFVILYIPLRYVRHIPYA